MELRDIVKITETGNVGKITAIFKGEKGLHVEVLAEDGLIQYLHVSEVEMVREEEVV